MNTEERRQKIIDATGIFHGAAEAKQDYDNLKKGTAGMITAYLPEDNKFAVMWPGKVWVTYDCSEEQFNEWFRLSAPEEVAWIQNK